MTHSISIIIIIANVAFLCMFVVVTKHIEMIKTHHHQHCIPNIASPTLHLYQHCIKTQHTVFLVHGHNNTLETTNIPCVLAPWYSQFISLLAVHLACKLCGVLECVLDNIRGSSTKTRS
jgi:hypothetical protein